MRPPDAARVEAGSRYLHGTDAVEQARLSRMNELLNGRSLAELELRPGLRVLDLGSGLGQLARAIAGKVGAGRVVGVERDLHQLERARSEAERDDDLDLVDFRRGDAHDLPLLPAEWGRFDLAHARFLLEHVTDPLAVVKGMLAAVRPGGRIVLEDDSHEGFRLWPEPPGFGSLWRGYVRTFDRNGNDPLVGHRLVELLHRAGAEPVRITQLFFGACAGQPELLQICVENLIRIIDGVRGPILDLGELDADSFDSAIAAIRRWGDRPDAALWYASSWAEGRRPA